MYGGANYPERDAGTGPYRIDKTLVGKLNNELYSMIFVSCFRAEYVCKFKRQEDEKDVLDAKVISDYHMKKLRERTPKGVTIYEDKAPELPPTKEERRAIEEKEIDEMKNKLRNEMNSYFS